MLRKTVKPLIVGAILVAICVVLSLVAARLLPPDTAQWVGFLLLFFATWVFTLWGYVIPKSEYSSE